MINPAIERLGKSVSRLNSYKTSQKGWRSLKAKAGKDRWELADREACIQ